MAKNSRNRQIVIECKKMVKCTLVQALQLCTGRTAHRGCGSIRVALLFLDHGTRRGEGPATRPGRSLPPGKTRYPLYRRLCGPQGRSRQVRKISPPPGFDPRTFQPIASRYNDCAKRPTSWMYNVLKDVITLAINTDNDQQTQRHDDTNIWPRTPILNNVSPYKCLRWRCTAVHVRGFFHCLIQTTSICASFFQSASIHEEGAHTITFTCMLCVYSLRNK